MTNTEMMKLAERLSERDWGIVASTRTYRFLTTRQLTRMHFAPNGVTGRIPRAANLALSRLRGLGLLANLARRIGGVRAGSSAHVWTVTDTGHRLLAWRDHKPRGARVRPYEPSSTFLEHTIAIAEVVLDLTEAATTRQITVSRVELEPAAWRTYLDRSGATLHLKPDLAVTTMTDEYEDAWFIEVDRDTEPPGRIVHKCLQYQDYRRSSTEQRKRGVFPAVVWVVPNQRRHHQLRARIDTEPQIDQRLFTIITPDQLGELIAAGANDFNNNTGGQKGRDPS